MKFFYKKFLVFVLIVSFVIPVAFFMQPKKSDAFLGCIMNALGILGGINSAVSGMMAVPTNDRSVGQNTTQIAGDQKSQTFKECMLDALVSNLVNTLIKNFTASTVQWINSGFQGSPSFVTNPQGFFANYGDEVAGQAISDLGALGEVLCSPFDLDIKLALTLGFDFSGRYAREIGCRLSDVQENVYRTFTSGHWGADGWSNWIAISHPRNNAMSAYLSANDAVSRSIAEKIGFKDQEINIGRGFLNFTECVEYEDPEIAIAREPKCLKEETKTPGSVIEGQLNEALPSGLRKIEVADEIDEILNALLNQAMQQVFSASGLLGQSQPSSRYGGRSALSQLRMTYEEEQRLNQLGPPAGLNCDDGPFMISPETKPISIENGNGQSESVVLVYGEKKYYQNDPRNSRDGKHENQLIYNWDENLGTFKKYETEVNGKQINSVYTWDYQEKKFKNTDDNSFLSIASLEEQIRFGCQNTANNRLGNQLVTEYTTNNPNYENRNDTGAGGMDEEKGKSRNLALRAQTDSSDIFSASKFRLGAGFYNHGPEKLIDGNIDASYGNTAMTGALGTHTRFFKIKLNEPSIIEEINIYPSAEVNLIKTLVGTFRNPTSLQELIGITTLIELENTKANYSNQTLLSFRTINTIINTIRNLALRHSRIEKIIITELEKSYVREISNQNDYSYSFTYIKPISQSASLLENYLSKYGYFKITFNNNINNNQFMVADRLNIRVPYDSLVEMDTDYYFPVSLAEVEIIGVPMSEKDDYIKKTQNTTSAQAPKSLAHIKSSNLNGIIIYNNGGQQSLNSTILVTIPTGQMPKTKITATLQKISSTYGTQNINNIGSIINLNDFKIYRVVSANQSMSSGAKLTTPTTNDDNSVAIKIADPITLENAYYKMDIPLKKEVGAGVYKLKLTFTEPDTNPEKTMGDFIISFELRNQ